MVPISRASKLLQSEKKTKHFFAITMQYSTLTRIIIIYLMIVHMSQAYTLSVCLDFFAVCHVYITDCHGTILRDAGRKSCSQNKFHWPDAPDTYCLHIYPVTER
ncbi:uncharacterized protein OCT59_024267 [Rhizophagus irregularis]|nr:hypothetical protein OCT59_024267 [Rhizophagus irregularis]